MGILSDLLKGKNKDEVVAKPVEEQSPTPYNRIWLNRISNESGFIISSDSKKVGGILGALNRKDGHCPCGGNGIQFLCPCINMRDRGLCKCGLFENIRPVSPAGNSSGRLK